MPATAEDLPPELFEHILWHVQRGSTSPRERKRVLSACSLVCRYWANQARNLMHSQLTLRSAEDIRTLTQFVRSPAPAWFQWPIYNSIACLILDKTIAFEKPWTHHIYPLMELLCGGGPHTVSLPVCLRLHIRFSAGTVTPKMRSVHWDLPKTLPRSFTAMIEHLHLHGIGFATLADLLAMVKELSRLGSLSCEKLTWKTLGAIHRTRKLPAKYSDIYVKARDCTDDIEICLQVLQHARRFDSHFNPEDGAGFPFYITIACQLESEGDLIRDIIRLLHVAVLAAHPNAELRMDRCDDRPRAWVAVNRQKVPKNATYGTSCIELMLSTSSHKVQSSKRYLPLRVNSAEGRLTFRRR